MTNIKDLLKSHIETIAYLSLHIDCLSFLKYAYIRKEFKCNHQVIEETMLQLHIFCNEVKPLVPGMVYVLLIH